MGGTFKWSDWLQLPESRILIRGLGKEIIGSFLDPKKNRVPGKSGVWEANTSKRS
jgi:hypothetical protein